MAEVLENYILTLTQISTRKQKYLEEILILTQKQQNNIKDENEEMIVNIINEKQQRIDNIDELDKDFEINFNGLKDEMGINNISDYSNGIKGGKELKLIISKIQETIVSISEIEEANNVLAKKFFENLRNEVKKINYAKITTTAYRVSPTATPSFYFDKKK